MRKFIPNRISGFTLIEILIVLAMISIMVSLVSVSVSEAMNASRSTSGKATLIGALTRARSFAASGNVDVVLCPSVDNKTCSSGFHWENGWIGFAAIDAGSDRTGNDPLLLQQGPLLHGMHLVTTKGRTRIRFQPSGGNAGSNVTFTFCDGRGPKAATAYAMSNAGNLHPTQPMPANVAEACAGL
ncbi:MAG TPA: GspH/FimT family pseudopilin [Hyphomicrobiales bacterium]|nr:GspH/FimT family pseudopilin [Hyphomicrobiales bacterium]